MNNVLPNSKNSFLLFLGVLLFCFVFSAGVRYKQFKTWEKTPAEYFVGEIPMMTTLDAPYWLRFAREYKQGTLGQKTGLRLFPENTFQYKKLSIPQKFIDKPSPNFSSTSSSSFTNKMHYSDVPLLGFIIAHFSSFFHNNYYLTGTLLIPFMSSLFILPLGIFFFQIGYPLSGLLGGLIGTFAGGFYMRSSIGRIDTDMLNLFFPVLAGLLVLKASLSKSERSVLLYSIAAGFSLYLFYWWYERSGFTLAYFSVLIFSLFVNQIRFRTILLSSLLFVLCSHPSTIISGTTNIQNFINNYFVIEDASTISVIENEVTPAIFPNTFTTISEVSHVSFDEVFRRVLSNTLISQVGFYAFFVLVFLRWRVFISLLPILALGLLSFQSSNRFIMYLGPFIGIGLGWLLSLGIEAIFLLNSKNIDYKDDMMMNGEVNKVKGLSSKEKVPFLAKFFSWLSNQDGENELVFKLKKVRESQNQKGTNLTIENGNTVIDWWNWARQGTLYLGVGVVFWLISSQTAISFVPGPSIHPKIFSTFLEVKKRVQEDSVLYTWWDYGHTLIDVTNLATFHDGASQGSPRTYFIARSFISKNPDELYKIVQFLATEGNRGIAGNNTSPKNLIQAVQNPKHKPWNPIYLFFTADMTGKYGAISKLGSWDIEKGGSRPRSYQNLACAKMTSEELSCRGATIDLKAGKINNQVPLRRIIFIREGRVLREQEFVNNRGYTIQLIVTGRQIVEVQLIDEEVFRSNYNQMFLLGRYREDLFEETYNAFPFSRLFRIKFQQ